MISAFDPAAIMRLCFRGTYDTRETRLAADRGSHPSASVRCMLLHAGPQSIPLPPVTALPGKAQSHSDQLGVDIFGRGIVIAGFDVELVALVVNPDRETHSAVSPERGGTGFQQRLVLSHVAVDAGEAKILKSGTADGAGAHYDVLLKAHAAIVDAATADQIEPERSALPGVAVVAGYCP